MDSSTQIDVLMTTDAQCFDSTGVYPFSGSDHHQIVSHFYPRGMCVDPHPIDLFLLEIFRNLTQIN